MSNPNEERLQKVMARAGIASRRACEDLISAGRVKVNGEVVTQLGTKVDINQDEVTVDDAPIYAKTGNRNEKIYLMLNKPAGYLSTVSDPQGRPTILELIELAENQRLYPVGRLDSDTKGLILLTNDGTFANALTHPKHGVEKEYLVLLDGIVAMKDLVRLRNGVEIPVEDVDSGEKIQYKTKPAKAELIRHEGSNSLVKVIIKEGKKRQIRLMADAIEHPVVELRRVRLGPLKLADLPEGKSRKLSRAEIAGLLEAATTAEPEEKAAKPASSSKSAETERPAARSTRSGDASSSRPAARGTGRPRSDSARPDRRSSERSFGGERGGRPGGRSFGGEREGGRPDRGERRPFQRRDDEGGERKPFQRRDEGGDRGERRSYADRGERRPSFRSSEGGERRPFQRRDDGGDRGERRPFPRRDEGGERGERRSYADRGERRPFQRRDDEGGERRPSFRSSEGGERRPFQRRDDEGGERGGRPGGRSFGGERDGGRRDRGERRPFQRRDDEGGERKPFQRRDEGGDRGERRSYADRGERRPSFRSSEGGERRPFQRRDDGGDRGERRPFPRRDEGGERGERRSYADRGERKPFQRRDDGGDRGERRPFRSGGSSFGGDRSPRSGAGRSFGGGRPGGGFRGPRRDDASGERRPFPRRDEGGSEGRGEQRDRPRSGGFRSGPRRPFGGDRSGRPFKRNDED